MPGLCPSPFDTQSVLHLSQGFRAERLARLISDEQRMMEQEMR